MVVGLARPLEISPIGVGVQREQTLATVTIEGDSYPVIKAANCSSSTELPVVASASDGGAVDSIIPATSMGTEVGSPVRKFETATGIGVGPAARVSSPTGQAAIVAFK